MTVIVTLINDSIIQFINCAYTKAFRLIKILDSENEIKSIDVYVPSIKQTLETYNQFYDYYKE